MLFSLLSWSLLHWTSSHQRRPICSFCPPSMKASARSGKNGSGLNTRLKVCGPFRFCTHSNDQDKKQVFLIVIADLHKDVDRICVDRTGLFSLGWCFEFVKDCSVRDVRATQLFEANVCLPYRHTAALERALGWRFWFKPKPSPSCWEQIHRCVSLNAAFAKQENIVRNAEFKVQSRTLGSLLPSLMKTSWPEVILLRG